MVLCEENKRIDPNEDGRFACDKYSRSRMNPYCEVQCVLQNVTAGRTEFVAYERGAQRRLFSDFEFTASAVMRRYSHDNETASPQ